jgi:uncharacterized protein YegL
MDIQLRTAFLGFRDFVDGDAQFKDKLLFTDKIKEEFIPFVTRIKAEGGGDLVEDVVGAFDRASKWSWTGRFKCLVFIGDSPGHTSELHTYNKHDKNWGSHPLGLKHADVMQKLAAEDVGVFFCRINEQATKKMETVFRQLYEDPTHNKKSRKFASLDMVKISGPNPFETNLSANHLVFVIDESGSMGGRPWNEAVSAYQSALQKRITDVGKGGSQAGSDRVSVVQFGNHARHIFTNEPITTCPKNLVFGDGGTNFKPACEYAAQALKQTVAGTNPILIFMSDGEGGGGKEGMELVRTAMQSYGGFKCFTVAFGSGASSSTLKMMADVHGSKGAFRKALSGSDLSKVFVEAVGSVGKPQEAIFRSIGKSLNEQISQKLQLDWL